MPKYHHVYIPVPLARELQSILRDHPELGYRSTSDATREALRRFIRELKEDAARAPPEAPPSPPVDPQLKELLGLLGRFFEPRRDAPPSPRRR